MGKAETVESDQPQLVVPVDGCYREWTGRGTRRCRGEIHSGKSYQRRLAMVFTTVVAALVSEGAAFLPEVAASLAVPAMVVFEAAAAVFPVARPFGGSSQEMANR